DSWSTAIFAPPTPLFGYCRVVLLLLELRLALLPPNVNGTGCATTLSAASNRRNVARISGFKNFMCVSRCGLDSNRVTFAVIKNQWSPLVNFQWFPCGWLNCLGCRSWQWIGC